MIARGLTFRSQYAQIGPCCASSQSRVSVYAFLLVGSDVCCDSVGVPRYGFRDRRDLFFAGAFAAPPPFAALFDAALAGRLCFAAGFLRSVMSVRIPHSRAFGTGGNAERRLRGELRNGATEAPRRRGQPVRAEQFALEPN